ncbi:DUF3883 domain-containing protein [Candidatus Peregrinibacteria bacterium]|nr:DUF3883 domain-containing protein [Candidatus Peregrinibacteria bacterium]
MVEIELPSLNFNEYNEEISLYKNYKEKCSKLEEEKKSLEPPFLFIYGIVFILSFLGVISYGGNLKGDFWGSCFVSIILAFYFSIFLHAVLCSDFAVNIISFGKLNKLNQQKEKLEGLLNDSYSRLHSFEKKIREHLENQLEGFFENNLYRKRAGNAEFEESLSEFASLIEEVSKIKLVTTYIPLKGYQDYLEKRTTNHIFQSSKKKRDPHPINSLIKNILEKSPKQPKKAIPPEKFYRTVQKINNWEEINKKRTLTGLKGEEVIVVLEQDFFRSIGREDLAQKVRHVSAEDGDGLGYDILSFFEDGKEKYIEVKSTTASLNSPFYLSRNELAFLKEHDEDAFIYRVFLSEKNPEIISYSSSEVLNKNDLIPMQYMVKLK